MEETGHDLTLSLDEARRSPEAFRDRLIRNVETNTEFGGRVWKKLNRSGTIFLTDVTLDPNTWIGETLIVDNETGRKAIRLGIQPIPQPIAEQVFVHRQLSESQSIVYRFTHELAHDVAFEADVKSEKFSKLFGLAQNMRRQGSGLTSLGNLDFYHKKGSIEQATEDVVELLNMLITSKDFLNSYLDFLSDPKNENIIRSRGLASFSNPQVRIILEDSLADGLRAFLES